jgi:hypothetical protein
VKGTVEAGTFFLVVETVARIFADKRIAVPTKVPIVYFTWVVRHGWLRRTDFWTRKGAQRYRTIHARSGAAVTGLVRDTFISAAELAVATPFVDKCSGTCIAVAWLSRRTRYRTRGGFAKEATVGTTALVLKVERIARNITDYGVSVVADITFINIAGLIH